MRRWLSTWLYDLQPFAGPATRAAVTGFVVGAGVALLRGPLWSAYVVWAAVTALAFLARVRRDCRAWDAERAGRLDERQKGGR